MSFTVLTHSVQSVEGKIVLVIKHEDEDMEEQR